MKIAIPIVCLFLMVSCNSGRKVTYESTSAVETTTVNFGSSDLRSIAGTMVQSLLEFGPIVEITKTKRPVVYVHKIENKTMEHIDLESVTDSIRTGLIRSGKFRFVDMKIVDETDRQLRYQNQKKVVDSSTAKSFGKQIGSDYMLYGAISSIEKSAGRVRDVYYKFTLNLVDVETGILEWSDEKEIRKTGKKRMIGM